jgi:hypothetical protein
MLKEALALNAVQLLHWLQASKSALSWVQLIVLANKRALVVLPTPLGPQNKKAWAKCLFFIAFFKV